MSKKIVIFLLTVVLFGCNINPNKEEKIQILEAENENLLQKINFQFPKKKKVFFPKKSEKFFFIIFFRKKSV